MKKKANKTKALSQVAVAGYLGWMAQTVPPAWSVDAAHLKLIAQHLDRVESGEIDRLAIHMPPRHAKSETVTYRFPVRWLELHPTDNVLVTGYNERFARKLGRRNRNLAVTRNLVAPSKAASDEWETNEGGLLMARGVGSPPTGTGFKLIVIDDPVRRREDAESELFREKTWDWYTDDLYTRLEPGGAIVLIMTRWHEDDLGARAIASEPGRWVVLTLPAFAQENDPLGRAVGEPLWPERYNKEALGRIRDVQRRKGGDRSFEALYQQNPTPREGSFFKPDRIERIPAAEVPANLRKVSAWDIGATEGDGDPTARVKLGSNGDGFYYVLDAWAEQMGTDRRDARIKSTAADDGKGVAQRLPQDPGAAGKSQAAAFVRLLAGYSVLTKPVSGSKETRADPFSSQVNAGNVRMLVGDWNAAFIEELRQFPGGRHDDMVDAASDAFDELAQPVQNLKKPSPWGGTY
jgi:predicted phage terminase large subunit-like protein